VYSTLKWAVGQFLYLLKHSTPSEKLACEIIVDSSVVRFSRILWLMIMSMGGQ